MSDDQRVVYLLTTNLDFDPENPRFYRLNDPSSVPLVIEEMLEDESVQDLMLSIGQKGYFEGEPLLVVPEPPKASEGGGSQKKYTVVEGNRRLAAVKLLNQELSPALRRTHSVEEIRVEAAVKPPTLLPCLIYENRRDVLRYLGYRHITGIKEWDSLSKAKYLAQLRDQFYSSIGKADQLKGLAKDIGSRTDYVGQLLTALSLYIRAEEKKFFGLPVQAKDVEFSYLTTALNYSKICDWLGLSGRIDIDMPGIQEENLKKAFAWMFAKDQQGKTILGESRNLGELAAIVASQEAVANLEETGRLDEAYLYTDGPASALQQAIEIAIQRVSVVWKMLPKTNPVDSNHLSQAEDLFEQARAVRNSLRDKLEA